MGLCPTPRFLFENKNSKEETSHDDPINHYLDEPFIVNDYRILGVGIATHVDIRVRHKEIKLLNKTEENIMIEAMMSVFVFLVLPVAFLVSLGKGHDETIEGVPPYPKNK